MNAEQWVALCRKEVEVKRIRTLWHSLKVRNKFQSKTYVWDTSVYSPKALYQSFCGGEEEHVIFYTRWTNWQKWTNAPAFWYDLWQHLVLYNISGRSNNDTTVNPSLLPSLSQWKETLKKVFLYNYVHFILTGGDFYYN